MRVVELEHLSLWERCFFSKKVILNITEAAREETIYFEEEVLKTKSDKIFWTYMVQRVQSWVVE